MPFCVQRVHTVGHGRAAPPLLFERKVDTLEDASDLVFSGILSDHSFFRDGYTSDDDSADKDAVHQSASRAAQRITEELQTHDTVTIESRQSAHNAYAWTVKRLPAE